MNNRFMVLALLATGLVTTPLYSVFSLNGIKRKVAESNLPIILKFSTQSCGPCRTMKPHFDNVKAQLSNKITFLEIDSTGPEGQKIAQHYGIRSVPTLLFFKRGKELARESGGLTEPIIRNFIKQYLSI